MPVIFTRLRPQPKVQQAMVPVFSDRLSAPLRVPGTLLDVRLHADAPVGTAWTLTVNSEPALDLGELLTSLEGLDQDSLLALFGAAPVEPYRSWKNLWESDQPMPYRLGAVLLALASRTNELAPRATWFSVFTTEVTPLEGITPNVVYYYTTDGLITQGLGV